MQRRRQIVALGAALVMSLAAAPAASANEFERVYDEFKKRGSIHPCRFTERELDNAAKQTPPDIEQYVPSFLDALEAARDRRPSCDDGPKRSAPAPVPAPAAPAPPSGGSPAAPAAPATTGPTAAPPPAPDPGPAEPRVSGVPSPPAKATERESGTPAPIWILAALGALAALAALAAGVAWWLGLSPAWLASLRSSFSEAGERIGDFGFEFVDWVRTGR